MFLCDEADFMQQLACSFRDCVQLSREGLPTALTVRMVNAARPGSMAPLDMMGPFDIPRNHYYSSMI